MPRFRERRPEVEATQWQPGVAVDGLIEVDAPMGSDNRVGLLDIGRRQVVVEPGDWIVAFPGGERRAFRPAELLAHFEAAP